MDMFDTGVVFTLLGFAPGAHTVKVVLLVQHQFASRDILDPLVYVTDSQLVTSCDGPARDDELSIATEDRHTVRPAAVIEEVRWPVEAGASPQQCLVRDSKCVHLDEAVDVHNHLKVLDVDGKFGASKENNH